MISNMYEIIQERDTLIDDLVWYKVKVNRLERDNNQFIHDNNQLLHENEGLREHSRELQAQQGSREYAKALEKENLKYFKENKALREQMEQEDK